MVPAFLFVCFWLGGFNNSFSALGFCNHFFKNVVCYIKANSYQNVFANTKVDDFRRNAQMQAQWALPVITAQTRPWQEEHKFEVGLS